MTNRIFSDGNWLLYRAHSVIGKSSSAPEKRIPNLLLDWFSQGAVRFRCTEGALCFDGPNVFRHKVYAGYKASRSEKKAEKLQKHFEAGGLPSEVDSVGALIAPTMELFQKHGIPVVQKEIYEADDMLISASTTYSKKPGDMVILQARDKDLLQGITEQVHMWTPAMGLEKEVIWTPKRVLEKRGMTPRQFLKYQILVGDATDDIPPIPMIGSPSKAKKIVLEFDKLTDFFMTDEGGKIFKKYKSELHRNRQLVSMVKDAWDLKDIRIRPTGVNQYAKSFAALKSDLSKKSLF